MEKINIKKIFSDILHYSFTTFEQHREKSRKFSYIASEALLKQGKRSSILKVIFKPIWRFIKSYFIKMGFLDGYRGWVAAKISAEYAYLKYKNLLTLQRKIKR